MAVPREVADHDLGYNIVPELPLDLVTSALWCAVAGQRTRPGTNQLCKDWREMPKRLANSTQLEEGADMLKFLSPQWWEEYRAELNQDVRWREAAKWFEARIQFEFETGVACIDILSGGKVVSVSMGSHALGSDIVLSAPLSEWEKIYNFKSNFYQATSPGLGEMSIAGDAVLAMRNIKVMWLMLEAMKRVGQPIPVRPTPSPDPRPSGKDTIGRYVNVNGLRTYYEEAGEGPAIVCIHAACQDTLMYRHVLDGLSDEYRVISIDAPGHGKTLMPQGGAFENVTRHSEFNEAFMDALGLTRPAIIGCSMGGNQVLELGSRRPGGYSAIISSEGADYTPTVSEFTLDVIGVDGQMVVEGWSETLTGNRTPADRGAEVIWQLRRNVPEIMKADLVGYAGFDRRGEMQKITDPVLMIRGDADWLVSQEAIEETASRIKGAKISVLVGTGHYPMIENPYEFNQIVRTFLHGVNHK